MYQWLLAISRKESFIRLLIMVFNNKATLRGFHHRVSVKSGISGESQVLHLSLEKSGNLDDKLGNIDIKLGKLFGGQKIVEKVSQFR